jgi:branched-chain amino acid transport system substrate-binding protein
MKIGAPVVATALAASAVVATTTVAANAATKSVTLAVEGPFSGPNASYGAWEIGGVRTAIAAYNKTHPKVKVLIKQYDSQATATGGATESAAEATNRAVVGVIGGEFSGETKAALPALTQAGLAVVSGSATEVDLTQNHWNFFRVVANDNAQGPADAKLLTKTLKLKKVYVVDDSSVYGQGLATIVKKKLGSAMVGSSEVSDPTATTPITDFSATIASIKTAGATGVFWGGYDADAATFIKQLRAQGWTGKFVSDDGTETATFLTAAGVSGKGVYATSGGAAPTKAFIKAYKKANGGKAPGAYSMEYYDSTEVFLHAIQKGNTTRASILAAVKKTNFKGLTKKIKFTKTGEVVGAPMYYYEDVTGKAWKPMGLV